jgi:hypothetical protein
VKLDGNKNLIWKFQIVALLKEEGPEGQREKFDLTLSIQRNMSPAAA